MEEQIAQATQLIAQALEILGALNQATAPQEAPVQPSIQDRFAAKAEEVV